MAFALQNVRQKAFGKLQVAIDPVHAADVITELRRRGLVDTNDKDVMNDVATNVMLSMKWKGGTRVGWNDCDLRHGQHWPPHLKAAKVMIEELFECPLQPPDSPRSRPLVALQKLAAGIATSRSPGDRRLQGAPSARGVLRSRSHSRRRPTAPLSRPSPRRAGQARQPREQQPPITHSVRARRGSPRGGPHPEDNAPFRSPPHNRSRRHDRSRSRRRTPPRGHQSTLQFGRVKPPGSDRDLRRGSSADGWTPPETRATPQLDAQSGIAKAGGTGQGHVIANVARVPNEDQPHDALVMLPHASRAGGRLLQACRELLCAPEEAVESMTHAAVSEAGTVEAVAATLEELASNPENGLVEPQTSEAQGLAYVFRFLNADPDVIRLFAKFHGNMKLVLGDDMRKVGEFLAVYPGAANALPFWIAPKPSMPLTPQLLNACCEALSEESSPVTFSFLNSALGEPMSDVETISALTNLVQTRACGDDKHRRFSILAAALQVSEDPIRTVEVVRQQGFNLKNALSPVDFGRAMGTNLLEWETVCAWVAAPVSEEGRNAAHVGPAQFGKPNSATSRLEPATGRSARAFTASEAEDHADLRAASVPPDPEAMVARFSALRASPRRSGNVELLRFEAPDMGDFRSRRREFWKALAAIEVFPNELYAFTEHADSRTSNGIRVPNSTVSGCSGQEVVKTPFGTITWVPNDRRLSVPAHCKELRRRVRCGFEPWNPDSDLPKAYHGKRMPKEVAFLLNGMGRPRDHSLFRK